MAMNADTETLRRMREKRKHTFSQMLSALGLSIVTYRRLQEANLLGEVIKEYANLPDPKTTRKKPLAERLSDTYALKMLNRSHLPAVGSTLRSGEQVVKVIRHTGQDSVVVEWTDEFGLKRRAEWTTRANPRCTDLGQWERING